MEKPRRPRNVFVSRTHACELYDGNLSYSDVHLLEQEGDVREEMGSWGGGGGGGGRERIQSILCLTVINNAIFMNQMQHKPL